MNSKVRIFVVSNIKLPINASFKEAFSIAKKRLIKCNLNTARLEYKIYRRSIDARKKNDIHFVYSVAVSGEFSEIDDSLLLSEGIIELTQDLDLKFEKGSERLKNPPLIVGTGPCGIFAALLLAEEGYNPIVIERGSSVSDRKKAVNTFFNTGVLDAETNIQFGAGGAGTFSDGKLVTRINDSLTGYILRRFVEFGAPGEIEYLARPHIGTDILSGIVEKMLLRIEELGGKVLYNTKLLSISDETSVAHTTKADIQYGALILAIGHSARDTYESLFKNNFSIIPKSFSVGMRIEHLADDIDRAMYGDAPREILGRAEYNLSYNTKERGVYTFCMCPGGTVVAAASEAGGVCVNGMSEHSRNSRNSNSAVVCSIFPEDYGNKPDLAISFQRQIERAAFISAGENYSAPIITVGDFLNDKCSLEPTKIKPSYMNGNNVALTPPTKYLPKIAVDSIKNAICHFDRKIEGFAAPYAVLTGPETRTSAPIRILRDPATMVAVGFNNVYPAGEGAGYAGGITSAAVDGVRTAIAIMKKYAPKADG